MGAVSFDFDAEPPELELAVDERLSALGLATTNNNTAANAHAPSDSSTTQIMDPEASIEGLRGGAEEGEEQEEEDVDYEPGDVADDEDEDWTSDSAEGSTESEDYDAAFELDAPVVDTWADAVGHLEDIDEWAKDYYSDCSNLIEDGPDEPASDSAWAQLIQAAKDLNFADIDDRLAAEGIMYMPQAEWDRRKNLRRTVRCLGELRALCEFLNKASNRDFLFSLEVNILTCDFGVEPMHKPDPGYYIGTNIAEVQELLEWIFKNCPMLCELRLHFACWRPGSGAAEALLTRVLERIIILNREAEGNKLSTLGLIQIMGFHRDHTELSVDVIHELSHVGEMRIIIVDQIDLQDSTNATVDYRFTKCKIEEMIEDDKDLKAMSGGPSVAKKRPRKQTRQTASSKDVKREEEEIKIEERTFIIDDKDETFSIPDAPDPNRKTIATSQLEVLDIRGGCNSSALYDLISDGLPPAIIRFGLCVSDLWSGSEMSYWLFLCLCLALRPVAGQLEELKLVTTEDVWLYPPTNLMGRYDLGGLYSDDSADLTMEATEAEPGRPTRALPSKKKAATAAELGEKLRKQHAADALVRAQGGNVDDEDDLGYVNPAPEPALQPSTEPTTATEPVTEPATEPTTEPTTGPATEAAKEPPRQPTPDPAPEPAPKKPRKKRQSEVDQLKAAVKSVNFASGPARRSMRSQSAVPAPVQPQQPPPGQQGVQQQQPPPPPPPPASKNKPAEEGQGGAPPPPPPPGGAQLGEPEKKEDVKPLRRAFRPGDEWNYEFYRDVFDHIIKLFVHMKNLHVSPVLISSLLILVQNEQLDLINLRLGFCSVKIWPPITSEEVIAFLNAHGVATIRKGEEGETRGLHIKPNQFVQFKDEELEAMKEAARRNNIFFYVSGDPMLKNWVKREGGADEDSDEDDYGEVGGRAGGSRQTQSGGGGGGGSGPPPPKKKKGDDSKNKPQSTAKGKGKGRAKGFGEKRDDVLKGSTKTTQPPKQKKKRRTVNQPSDDETDDEFQP